jgi:transposase InsO family protein
MELMAQPTLAEFVQWASEIGPQPRSPWQNGYVEPLIGSIRRESLEHLVVFGEAHLRAVLKDCASYYNEVRTHLSLDKDAPDFRRTQKIAASQRYQSSLDSITNTSGFRF